MNNQTSQALFEARSALLGAWVFGQGEPELQREIFQSVEGINDILVKHGIDPVYRLVNPTRL